MNATEKDKFESLWTDFITLVKGKLISAATKQNLSTSLANLILSEAAYSWSSEYEINGKWLSNLRNTNAKKAELVNEVLLTDMHFTDMKMKGELSIYYNYIIPIVGAFAGYAIGSYFDCGKIVLTASIIIPAVLLYWAVNIFRKRMNESNNEKLIEAYIQQLEKYKNSVAAILS